MSFQDLKRAALRSVGYSFLPTKSRTDIKEAAWHARVCCPRKSECFFSRFCPHASGQSRDLSSSVRGSPLPRVWKQAFVFDELSHTPQVERESDRKLPEQSQSLMFS